MAMQSRLPGEDVEQTVFTALEQFGADPGKISRDASFETLDIDSLDLVELAQIVEDEYGVQIKNEDMEGIWTVGQAIDLVMDRR